MHGVVGNLEIEWFFGFGLLTHKAKGFFRDAEHQLGVGEVVGESLVCSLRECVAGFVAGVAIVQVIALVAGVAAHVPLAKVGADIAKRLQGFRDGHGTGIDRHVRDTRNDGEVGVTFFIVIVLSTIIHEHGKAVAR